MSLREKMTDKDFERMEANVTMQRFYLERENQLYLMQLDDDFHRMFFKICNNAMLLSVRIGHSF